MLLLRNSCFNTHITNLKYQKKCSAGSTDVLGGLTHSKKNYTSLVPLQSSLWHSTFPSVFEAFVGVIWGAYKLGKSDSL